MEDYHVDRPEVEVQQCMQLTGTNHPSGLIPFGIACSKRPRTVHVDELRSNGKTDELHADARERKGKKLIVDG